MFDKIINSAQRGTKRARLKSFYCNIISRFSTIQNETGSQSFETSNIKIIRYSIPQSQPIWFRLTLETIIGLEIKNNNRPVLADFLQIILSRQKAFIVKIF